MGKILIIDFGSQHTKEIEKAVIKQKVYAETQAWNIPIKLTNDIEGIIFSGGHNSVYDKDAPDIDINEIIGKVPTLWICYGAQLLAKNMGGNVEKKLSEYAVTELHTMGKVKSKLLKNVPHCNKVQMNHGDTITRTPQGAKLIASTKSVTVAGFELTSMQAYAIQFHPEVHTTQHGSTIFSNFISLCGCKRDFTPANFIDSTIDKLKDKIGSEKAILGISGGVDSTVAAVLLKKAIGNNLTCIFVDNGLLRMNEFEEVLTLYKEIGLSVIGVDASDRFLDKLVDIDDPEQKRKIIGATFIDVFEEEANKIGEVSFLGQGTIYPDVIESVSVHGKASGIKSHHNVGGLPERMNLKLVEPLRDLFKDEVREVGRQLGITEKIIDRQPFPGPGLAIRIPDTAVTKENLAITRQANYIFRQKVIEYGLYHQIWQFYAAYDKVKSVGQKGDGRVHLPGIKLRAITSTNAMTAGVYHFTPEFLDDIGDTLLSEIPGICRVYYDITKKPPGTIEQEWVNTYYYYFQNDQLITSWSFFYR